jgi:hypothetical protein
MGKLMKDTAGQPIQGFAPSRVQAVVAATPWTPGGDDRVFVATEDVASFSISGGTTVALIAYFPIVIVPKKTYTFGADTSLLVA